MCTVGEGQPQVMVWFKKLKGKKMGSKSSRSRECWEPSYTRPVQVKLTNDSTHGPSTTSRKTRKKWPAMTSCKAAPLRRLPGTAAKGSLWEPGKLPQFLALGSFYPSLREEPECPTTKALSPAPPEVSAQILPRVIQWALLSRQPLVVSLMITSANTGYLPGFQEPCMHGECMHGQDQDLLLCS